MLENGRTRQETGLIFSAVGEKKIEPPTLKAQGDRKLTRYRACPPASAEGCVCSGARCSEISSSCFDDCATLDGGALYTVREAFGCLSCFLPERGRKAPRAAGTRNEGSRRALRVSPKSIIEHMSRRDESSPKRSDQATRLPCCPGFPLCFAHTYHYSCVSLPLFLVMSSYISPTFPTNRRQRFVLDTFSERACAHEPRSKPPPRVWPPRVYCKNTPSIR